MNFLIKLFLSAIAVMLTSYLLPGIEVSDFLSALFFAALLALLNATIKPLLIIFTLPLTVFTLGLFLLVINAVVILMVDDFIPGVQVDGFWWALIFSLILTIMTSMLEGMTKDRRERRR
jgi:putative membrane protein